MRVRATLRSRPLAVAIAWALAAPALLLAERAAAQDIDLANLGDRGFRIDGIDAGDRSARQVSGAGDVNGDGFADVIIGADEADPGGRSSAGEAYVVFGGPGSATVDLASLGDRGFVIAGVSAGDRTGYSVSGAGDVNGDGLADLIVGALAASPRGRSNAGETYVVFGKAGGTTIDLATLGDGGFRIDGIDIGDQSGNRVSGAGDVNGDGLADLVVGAFAADPRGVQSAGESYVVFGKAGSAAVDLATLGAGGFRIEGIDAIDLAGESVSGAGDVNGDGFADLIIGASRADAGGVSDAGEAYVVFGKSDPGTVELSDLGARGFRIDGAEVAGRVGTSVAGAGDVNGDGLADLVVGAFGADRGAVLNAGKIYVVFGRSATTPVAVANLGAGGFQIDGIDANDFAGFSVAGAGDVNGDGLADLLIGAYRADPGGDSYAGESYVVFGKASSTSVDLAALGSAGFRLDGIDPFDASGRSVSGAGDVNGDGLADLVIAAYGAAPGGDLNAGETYVVFSTAVPLLSSTVRAGSTNGDPPRTAFGISGDGSNDDTPDARAWIDFADGGDPGAPASRETVTLTRTSGAFPAPGAGVAWRIQTTRQGWSTAEVRFRYVDSEVFVAENALQVFFSPNGQAPYLPLQSVVNPQDNTISANITQAGFFYLGQRTLPPEIFANGFEPAP